MQLFRPLPQDDLERAACPVDYLNTSERHLPLRKNTRAFSWNLFRLKEYKVPTHEPSSSSHASSSTSDFGSRSSIWSPSRTLTEVSSIANEPEQPSYKLTNNVRVFPHAPLPAHAEGLWQSKLPDRVRDECQQRIPDGRFSLHLWMSEAAGAQRKPCVIYIAHLGQRYSCGTQKDVLLKKIEKKLRKLESLRDHDLPFTVSAGPASLLGMPISAVPLPMVSSHDPFVNDEQYPIGNEVSSGGAELSDASFKTNQAGQSRQDFGTGLHEASQRSRILVYSKASEGSLETLVALPISTSGPLGLGGRCTVGGLIWIDSAVYALTTAHALDYSCQLVDEDAFSSLLAESEDEASVADLSDVPFSEHTEISSAAEDNDEFIHDQNLGKTLSAIEPLLDAATDTESLVSRHQHEEVSRSVEGDYEVHEIGTVVAGYGNQRLSSSGRLDYALISLHEGRSASSNSYKNINSKSVVNINYAISNIKELPAVGTTIIILAGFSGVKTAILGRIESRVTMDGLTMQVAQLLLETPLGKHVNISLLTIAVVLIAKQSAATRAHG